MMTTFTLEVKSPREAGIEAVRLAKGLLTREIKVTPYIVAKFNALAGYPNVEIFAHSTDNDDPFNTEEDYKENIYYYLYETGTVIRVTFQELERLIKIVIENELERGLYISENERDEYEALFRRRGWEYTFWGQ